MKQLNNEEIIAKADFAARQYAKEKGIVLTPAEYKKFVMDFVQDFYKPKYN